MSSPSLSSAGNYGTFTTDANGSHTGWFMAEPAGNARLATAGNQVFMRLILNDGNNGTSAESYLTVFDSATVLAFGTTADAVTGTGIYGNPSATDKNFAVLYDNATGTGRPLAATVVENGGAAENTANSYVLFYNNNVDGISSAWGTIIPNLNANGVQRIEQRALADGRSGFQHRRERRVALRHQHRQSPRRRCHADCHRGHGRAAEQPRRHLSGHYQHSSQRRQCAD
jgi:hypothetical protein